MYAHIPQQKDIYQNLIDCFEEYRYNYLYKTKSHIDSWQVHI